MSISWSGGVSQFLEPPRVAPSNLFLPHISSSGPKHKASGCFPSPHHRIRPWEPCWFQWGFGQIITNNAQTTRKPVLRPQRASGDSIVLGVLGGSLVDFQSGGPEAGDLFRDPCSACLSVFQCLKTESPNSHPDRHPRCPLGWSPVCPPGCPLGCLPRGSSGGTPEGSSEGVLQGVLQGYSRRGSSRGTTNRSQT